MILVLSHSVERGTPQNIAIMMFHFLSLKGPSVRLLGRKEGEDHLHLLDVYVVKRMIMS